MRRLPLIALLLAPLALAPRLAVAESDLDGLTPEAQVEYQSKYFSVGEKLTVTAFGSNGFAHARVNEEHVIYQGRYRQRVDEDDFFREVGRDDLAESYATRRATRWGLMGGGVAVGLGAMVYGIAAASHDPCKAQPGDPNFESECIDKPGRDMSRAGVVMGVGVLAGGGLFLAGLLTNPHPAEPHELRRLADEYNVALRRRLAGPQKPPPPRNPPVLTFYVAPGAGRELRGLTLGVAF